MYDSEYVTKLKSCIKAVGRPPKYDSVDAIADTMCRYFEKVSDKYIKLYVQQKKSGEATDQRQKVSNHKTENQVAMPWTLHDLLVELEVGVAWADFKKRYAKYFEKQGDGEVARFVDLCNVAEDACKNQQIVGAMVGIYKESIVARLNGIAEKTEQVVSVVDKEKAVNEFLEKVRAKKREKGGL